MTGFDGEDDPIHPAVTIPRTRIISSAWILCMLIFSFSGYYKPFNKLVFSVFFTVWQDKRSIDHRVVQ